MGNESQLPVDEIVGFLNSYHNETLIKLKTKYPEYSEIFEIGIRAGEEIRDKNELEVRTELCIEGLKAIVLSCEEYIPKIRKKIRTSNRLSFTAQIIILISSGSIILLLKENYGKLMGYIGASLALIGSIISLIAQNRLSNLRPNSDDLVKTLEKLVSNKLEAQRILQELKISIKFQNSFETIKSFIIAGNDLSFKTQKLLDLI